MGPFPISHFPFPISHFPFPISHFPYPIVNEGNQNSIPLYLLDLGPIQNPVLPPSDAPGSHFPRGIVSMPVPILVKSVIVAVQDTQFAVTGAWSPAPNLVLLTPCDAPVSHFPRGIVSKPVPILATV